MPDFLEHNDPEYDLVSVDLNPTIQIEQISNPDHLQSPPDYQQRCQLTNDPHFVSLDMPYPEVVNSALPFFIQQINMHRIYDFEKRIAFFLCRFMNVPIF